MKLGLLEMMTSLFIYDEIGPIDDILATLNRHHKWRLRCDIFNRERAYLPARAGHFNDKY